MLLSGRAPCGRLRPCGLPSPPSGDSRDGRLRKGIRVRQATLAELATLIDGALIGDGDLMISGAASLRDAGPGEITLVDGSEKSRELAACLAAAVIATKTFVPDDRPAIQ